MSTATETNARQRRPGVEVTAEALAGRSEATVAELASATGLGLSTVSKALAALEAAGTAAREPGGRDGARRLPDRWAPVAAGPPADGDGEGEASDGGAVDGAGGRLGKGQLRVIVAGLLAERSEPVTPSALAKAAGGRSSGAVGNCLERLVADRAAVRVSERPKTYLPSTAVGGGAR